VRPARGARPARPGRQAPRRPANLAAEAGLDPQLVRAAAHLLAEQTGGWSDQLVLDRLPELALEAALARGQDAGDLLRSLPTDAGALQALLDLVTVQETWFFREPVHFEALVDRVLPGLPNTGTIWSAGCANGQESWSLAMALEEAGRSAWQVLGTDLSARALARAEQARYGARELRGLSAARQARFTVPDGGLASIAPRLRDRVRFARHNLAADPAPLPAGSCAVVFCRNTLIYLRPERRRVALATIARTLRPGGWLFLGLAESLWQVTDAFEAVRLGGAYAYRCAVPAGRSQPRRGRAAAARPAPPAQARRAPPSQARRAPPTAAPAGQAGEPAGDPVAAARQAVFERPDDPLAHLDLGLNLELSGDLGAARRSFAAARGALERIDPAAAGAALQGWRVDQLAALLRTKLADEEGG
jgi:chemotaxis methyl-accepting protein methylase